MSVYPFVEAEKVEHRNVAKACGLLEVSRSAFYEWRHHIPSDRAAADAALLERVRKVHEDSRGGLRIAAGASRTCPSRDVCPT